MKFKWSLLVLAVVMAAPIFAEDEKDDIWEAQDTAASTSQEDETKKDAEKDAAVDEDDVD